ncbi:MAG: cyclic nucleotide-binding domain-containing protein [Mariprofundaceae bacterium]|nr:cyclic nucleotide-binding domain-containing protein [Mariprofundaceae bacterium]
MANVDMKWLEENIFARLLSDNEQHLLLDIIEVKSYQQSDTLIAEGDASQGLFLLHSGTVSLQYEKHGQAVRIAKLEAGAQLGDMAFFNHDLASATVKALVTCEVYTLPKKSMEQLMQHHKELSHDLMLNTIRNLGSALKNMNGFNAFAQQYIQGGTR